MRALRGGALALTAAAVLGLSGCFGGGDDDAASSGEPLPEALPLAVAPGVAQPVAAVLPGEVVRPGTTTPKAFSRALTRRRPIVVAFTMPGVADDDAVIAALKAVRASGPSASGVAYFVFSLGQARRFGDLPDLLDVTGSPSVAVIGRDGVLLNLWEGLVDEELLRQSIADAKTARLGPGGVDPGLEVSAGPTGSPAGIALARKVDRYYAGAPGVRVRMRNVLGGKPAVGQMRFAIVHDRVAGAVAEMTIAGKGRSSVVATPGGSFIRVEGSSCWVDLGPAGFGQESTPTDLSRSGRFSRPRRQGAALLLSRIARDGEHAFRIDARTGRILEIRQDGAPSVLTDMERLSEAPEIPSPEPLC